MKRVRFLPHSNDLKTFCSDMYWEDPSLCNWSSPIRSGGYVVRNTLDWITPFGFLKHHERWLDNSISSPRYTHHQSHSPRARKNIGILYIGLSAYAKGPLVLHIYEDVGPVGIGKVILINSPERNARVTTTRWYATSRSIRAWFRVETVSFPVCARLTL